jgi:hypothetical protein
MLDFGDYKKVLSELEVSQSSSEDMYDEARECQYFLEKKDGQWEPQIIAKLGKRPRYTDDRCNPLVDAIAGEMEQNEYSIKITPTGGKASKDTAETIEGLIKNIENISGATLIYSSVSRSLVGAGLAGFEITQDYIDSDSFDQDLFIKPIEDFQNRVWFDDNSKLQDRSDAKFCWVLDEITRGEYEDKFPDGKMMSIGTPRYAEVYYDKPDAISVCRFFYKKPVDIKLVKMSNGSVYRDDEDFAQLADDLAANGITVTGNRVRKSFKVHQRIFDGGGWLTDEEETVFNLLPIVPFYGNFKVIDGKIVFRGAINKAMDMQRVHNMAISRQVEDVVLAPKPKYWGTVEQRRGHDSTISTLNTNANSWQDYNHVDGIPPPYMQGGTQVNQALELLTQSSASSISLSAGVYSPQLGDNANLQSGVALQKQIEKGDVSTLKYFSSMECGLKYAGKVIVGAIPNVYDSTRQARILNEDGTSEIVILNQPMIDQQTGQPIIINDLSIGEYDVTVDIGAAFKNRKEQAREAILAIAQYDPTVIELGRDVLLRNTDLPAMDDLADRARAIAISNNIIPVDQLTDEERAAIEQQQSSQQQQPDPMMVAAEAEMQKAQAQQMDSQVRAQQAQFEQQVKLEQISFEREKLQLEVQKFLREKDDKYNVEAAKISQGQQRIDLDTQKMINDFSLKLADLEAKIGQQLDAQVKSNNSTFS